MFSSRTGIIISSSATRPMLEYNVDGPANTTALALIVAYVETRETEYGAIPFPILVRLSS